MPKRFLLTMSTIMKLSMTKVGGHPNESACPNIQSSLILFPMNDSKTVSEKRSYACISYSEIDNTFSFCL